MVVFYAVWAFDFVFPKSLVFGLCQYRRREGHFDFFDLPHGYFNDNVRFLDSAGIENLSFAAQDFLQIGRKKSEPEKQTTKVIEEDLPKIDISFTNVASDAE